MVMVQFSFNSQPPTKGTAIVTFKTNHRFIFVSILSPQQRGLQLIEIKKDVIEMQFQFSAPNKGDCNSFGPVGLPKDTGFNSQPPTKGTAIGAITYSIADLIVSILSPQQRGLQYRKLSDGGLTVSVSILSPQQRGLQLIIYL